MRRFLVWIWKSGIIGNFLAGLFVLLPLVITVAILSWVGSILQGWLGPESTLGRALHDLGVRFVAEPFALLVGWSVVLVGIWAVGIATTHLGGKHLQNLLNSLVSRVPLLGSIYGSASQVVKLLARDQKGNLESATVVFCYLGDEAGLGLLGLQVSNQTFRFGGRECVIVYVPTSPVPMSGGIIFVPKESVFPLDMNVDALMQVYLSIGVLARAMVPPQYRLTEGEKPPVTSGPMKVGELAKEDP
jgi:uncharacterized membrane protein